MAIYKGSSKINELYLGSTKIDKVYKGSTLLYKKLVPNFTEYNLENVATLNHDTKYFEIDYDAGSTGYINLTSSTAARLLSPASNLNYDDYDRLIMSCKVKIKGCGTNNTMGELLARSCCFFGFNQKGTTDMAVPHGSINSRHYIGVAYDYQTRKNILGASQYSYYDSAYTGYGLPYFNDSDTLLIDAWYWFYAEYRAGEVPILRYSLDGINWTDINIVNYNAIFYPIELGSVSVGIGTYANCYLWAIGYDLHPNVCFVQAYKNNNLVYEWKPY